MRIKSANGRYWIGDPCYVFPDKRWSDFCDLYFKDEDNQIFVDLIGGKEEFFVCGTAYGDGCYPVSDAKGNTLGECGVDSGLLAAIPESLVLSWGDKEEADRLGVWVELGPEIKIKKAGGNFSLDNKIFVNTSEDEDDGED